MKLWTLLFDIDGTIMTSDHAGTSAMAKTAKEIFDVDEIGPLNVHGRCDRGILAELFESLGVSYDQHREEFCRRYYQNLPASLVANNARLLPGVHALLKELQQRDNVALGLLTGNLQIAAKLKLEHVEVDHFFAFGGYGDDFAERNDVAAQAVKSAKKALGDSFSENRIWVLGDTENDILCGRAVGAKVLAVQTGGGSQEELRAKSPDLLLPNFENCQQWLDSLDD